MRIYPAIDLKDGACVRLFKGDMQAATVYSDTPSAQARRFEAAGFDYLHVVDLNGAISGHSVNKQVVMDIVKAVAMPVQLGGGIRDRAAIDGWLAAGITRVILGTAALRNPALVKEAARAYPGKVAVGIDASAGMVVVEGWVTGSTMRALDLCKRFEDAGIAAIIYTDIARDGTLTGPNIEETLAIARAVTIPVILSGGMSSLADVKAVKAQAHAGIEGVIIGRALYEHTIDAAQALTLARA